MAKQSLDSITKKYFSDFENRYLQKSRLVGESYDSVGMESYSPIYSNVTLKSKFDVTEPQEFTYQTFLRPLFGKDGINDSKIGPHPDFAHLKETGDIEHHNIVTMFVDIKRSSRLALLMSLEEAYLVKNRILQACVDVVRSLDGYPHRLMGDALMAYFGDKNTSSEDAIANALNAASTLKLVLSEYVFPQLNNIVGDDIRLGIRVGLDFGEDDEVIWANYGYGDASEVTALGIPVDLAAKAQSQAKTNTAMLGQGVLEHIDFPILYSSVKTVKRNGEDVEEKFILPNMQYADGSKLNRRCRLLDMNNYQRLLPFSPENKEGKVNIISGVTSNDSFKYKCEHQADENGPWINYPSVSRFLDKNNSLKFTIVVDSKKLHAYGALVAVFTRTNHGKEARDNTDEGVCVSEEKEIVNNSGSLGFFACEVEQIASTSYRGLHTMDVKVYPKGYKSTILFQDSIGVYIK